LLLTWLHEPDAFREIENLDTTLERRSKTELITLIRTMIQRHPDLVVLPELSTVGDPDAGHPQTLAKNVGQTSSSVAKSML
jgi:hypothetical protein